jgi:hypothetical protein
VVKFGQSMFTPKDPTQTALILDDRPYAGLLYVGMAWNGRQHTPQNNTEILDTREITLGVIGLWRWPDRHKILSTPLSVPINFKAGKINWAMSLLCKWH